MFEYEVNVATMIDGRWKQYCRIDFDDSTTETQAIERTRFIAKAMGGAFKITLRKSPFKTTETVLELN